MKPADGFAVTIPRTLFGFHLAAVGCALLVWFGYKLEWYGRVPVIVALAATLAAFLLVRPAFVLTASGLSFSARFCHFGSVSYASIERRRIQAIQVGWERETVTGSAGGVVYRYRRPFLGIFLVYLWNDPPRETALCIERLRDKEVDVDMAVARKKAQQYARVLGCPLRTR